MGIRLNNSTPGNQTEKKGESESLQEGMELSASNPVQAPVEVEESVAPIENSPVETPQVSETIEASREPASKMDAFDAAAMEVTSEDPFEDAANEVIDAPKIALARAQVLARGVDTNRIRHVKEIAEEYKISNDEAMGMLELYPYEELKATRKYQDITHNYPATSKWAQKPENMKILQKDPDAFKKIEESSKMLSYLGDYGKVLQQNIYTIPMMGLHAAVSTGTVSIEDAADTMTQIQDAIDASGVVYNRKGMQAIGKGMESASKAYNKILPYTFADEKGDVTFKSVGKILDRIDKAANDKDYSFLTRIYKRYQGNKEGLLDFLGAVAKNPSAALLMTGQSAYSMVPGLVAPIVGAAAGGALGGPVGAAIGTVGASYTTGFAVAYTQFFQEESDKFRDKKTKKINFRKMYGDPDVVSKMRLMAAKYGAAHGAFEAIGGKLLGKTFSGAKNATKGKKVLALAVETAEQSLSEAGGEISGQLITGKSVGEAVVQGVAEGVFAAPFTPGAAILQATNLSRINAKEKKKNAGKPPGSGSTGPGTPPPSPPPAGPTATTSEVTPPGTGPAAPKAPPVFKSTQQIFKAVAEKMEAQKAIKNKEILTEMRETKKNSPALQEAPQQVQELIKESTNPTIEVGEENGVIIEEQTGEDAPMSFDVNQFEDLAERLGQDPMAMAENLGPNGVAAYINAKKGETGTFQVTADEYFRYSDNRPELDDIVYVGDVEMNAVEGTATAELAKELEENMFDSEDEISFEDTDFNDDPNNDDAPPPIPEQEQDFIAGPADDTYTTYVPSSADENLGDLISRPIELVQSTRTKAERTAYANILRKVTAALKKTPGPAGLAEAMANIQFSHLRFRAEATGKSITSLESEISVGYSSKLPEGVLGRLSIPGGYATSIAKLIFGAKSEASTVVHEFAHSWLHSMILDSKIVKDNLTRNAIQEDYHQAMLEVEKMFGVDSLSDIYKMDDKGSRTIHETFAQTAESYFLNGDMQNNGMRRVFEQVKTWMAQVASMVNRIGRSYPTLKLTPEIERMFRTILDASEEAENRTQEMFPEPLFTKETVGEKDAERYEKAVKDARDEAVARMYSKFFNGSLREREAAINQALDTINDQAIREVEATPAMILKQIIKAGGPESKITYQSILEHVAKGNEAAMEWLKGMVASGIIAPNKRKGVDARDVMASMDIHDPQDFLSILAQTGAEDTLIKERADQLIEENFPALKTDAEMHAEAEKAIQKAGREAVLKIELEILADKHLNTLQKMNESAVKSPANFKQKDIKVLKSEALGRVLRTAAAKLKTKFFLKESAKFNKQAASLVKQGDYLAAFDAKNQEAVNSFAYLEAVKAEKHLDKVYSSIKRLMSLSPKQVAQNFDFTVYKMARDFVEDFKAGRPLTEVSEMEGFDLLPQTKKDVLADLVNFVNKDLADTGNNPTVDGMIKFGALIDLIRHSARESKVADIAGKKADLKIVVDTMNAELIGNGSVMSFKDKARYKWRSGLMMMDNLFAGLMTEAEYAKSSAVKMLNSVRLAQNKKLSMEHKDNALLLAAIKKMNKNNPGGQQITKQIADATNSWLGRDTSKPFAAPAIGHTFNNKGEFLKTLATYMSESGRERLINGGIESKGKKPTGPLDPAALDKMFTDAIANGDLSEVDVEFVQTILDIFESHYEAVKKGAKHVDGIDIGYIKPREFKAFGRTFRGGYIPLKRGASMSKELSKKFDVLTTENNFIPEFYAAANTSMEKARVEATSPVNVDLSTLRTELNAVYTVAYLRPTMHEVGKVLGHKDFIAQMEARRPGAMKSIVAPWFHKTMAQEYIERIGDDKAFFQAYEGVINTLTNRAKRNVFLGNFFSALKQPIGIIPAFQVLPAHRVSASVLKFFLSPVGTYKRIKEASPVMAERFDSNARNAIRSMEDFNMNDTLDVKAGRIQEKATFMGIQFMQNITDSIVWSAAYKQAAVKLNLDHDQAVAYSDSVVIRTQSSNSASDVPGLRSSNAYVRLFTSFLTVPIAMSALQLEAKGRSKGKIAPEAAAMIMKSMMLTALFPAILSSLVSKPGAALKLIGGSEEEEEEAQEELAIRTISETFDSILPGLGQNVLAPFGGITFDKRFSEVGVMPLASQVEQGAAGIRAAIGRAFPESMADSESALAQRAFDKFNVDELSYRDFRDILTAFSLATGISVAAIPFTLNRVEQVLPIVNGEQEDSFEDIFNDLDLPR